MRKYEGPLEARDGSVRVYGHGDATYAEIQDADVVEYQAADEGGEPTRWIIGVRDGAEVSTGELSNDDWRALFEGGSTNLVRASMQPTFCPRCRTDESHRFCCPL
jgi:hypothetical protein